MKLDKGLAFYIYNGLKSILDIVCQDPSADGKVIARCLRQLDEPFRFSKNGDNQLSKWKCEVLEANK